MDTAEILETVNSIFKNVFDNPDVKADMTSTADDVDGWDSLSHTLMIVEIEKHFNIRFKLKEVLAFKNVGDMVHAIHSKIQ